MKLLTDSNRSLGVSVTVSLTFILPDDSAILSATLSLANNPTHSSPQGGSEHKLPIIVSKVHRQSAAALSGLYPLLSHSASLPDTLAYRHGSPVDTGQVLPGDTILSINSINLQGSTHSAAVDILSQARGNVELLLVSSVADTDEVNSGQLQYVS